MGSNKDQGKVGTGNSPRGVSGKRKRGRSATKHKKAERSNKNKHPNNKRRYKSTSSSSSTEKFSSPKRHKSQRKKGKYHKRSSSFCSSWPYSSLESSVTRSREGSLGRRFQVISEEDKFRYNLPTDRAKDANAHFETYVKEADLKQQILTENLVPDNLDQVKKLDHFVFDILKDKRKQKCVDMDSTLEKVQSKNVCVRGSLPKFWMILVEARGFKKSRYPLIWILLEPTLNKQCSCWARPTITSHILEGITF